MAEEVRDEHGQWNIEKVKEYVGREWDRMQCRFLASNLLGINTVVDRVLHWIVLPCLLLTVACAAQGLDKHGIDWTFEDVYYMLRAVRDHMFTGEFDWGIPVNKLPLDQKKLDLGLNCAEQIVRRIPSERGNNPNNRDIINDPYFQE